MKTQNWLLLLFALGCAACATIDSVKPGGGGVSFEVRGPSYERIWRAAVTVVGRSLTIVESNEAAGIIRAEAPAGMATWGEVVGVFISRPRVSDTAYRVEVQSQKRHRLQLTGQDWTQTIVSGIKAELGE